MCLELYSLFFIHFISVASCQHESNPDTLKERWVVEIIAYSRIIAHPEHSFFSGLFLTIHLLRMITSTCFSPIFKNIITYYGELKMLLSTLRPFFF